MSDYFTEPTDPVAGQLVRAAKFAELVDNVATAFDKLPTEDRLKKATATYGVDTGAANAYVIAMPSAPSSYTDGMEVVFKAMAANTGASTVNVNGLGLRYIAAQSGAAPPAGAIAADKIVSLRYNSTYGYFFLTNASVAEAAAYAANAAANAVSAYNNAVSAYNSAVAAYNSSVAAASTLVGTSATSLAVGSGIKSLTTQGSKQFAVSQWVVVGSTASPENYMFGQVTAYNTSTGALTINATVVGGSGTFAAWTITISGVRGPAPSAEDLIVDTTPLTGNLPGVTGNAQSMFEAIDVLPIIGITDRQLWSALLPIKGISGSLNVMGDSITVGDGATVQRTDGWGALLKTALFGADCENTTDEEVQCNFEEGLVTGPTLSAGATYGTTGPIQRSVVLAVGEYIQFSGNYDNIGCFYEQSATAGTLTFTRDGSTIGTQDCSGAAESDVCKFPIDTAGTGTHTYRITASVATCEVTGLIRLKDEPAAGRIHINRMARSGWSSKDFALTADSCVSQGGFKNFLGNVSFPVDGQIVSNAGSLYVLALGMNDIYYVSGAETHKTTPREYELNLTRIANKIWLNNQNNRIAVMTPYIPNPTPMSLLNDYPHGQYVEAARRAVASFGGLLIDCSTVDFVGGGLLDTDGLHPNNAGHQKLYDIFARSICESIGRTPVRGNYLLQQLDITSGSAYLFQPSIFVDRPSAGSATFIPISAYVAKIDNFDCTGTFVDPTITVQNFGEGTISSTKGLSNAVLNEESTAELTLVRGFGNYLASNGPAGEWRQNYGATFASTGALGILDQNTWLYCPELKNAKTTAVYCLNSVGFNTPSYHAGVFTFGSPIITPGVSSSDEIIATGFAGPTNTAAPLPHGAAPAVNQAIAWTANNYLAHDNANGRMELKGSDHVTLNVGGTQWDLSSTTISYANLIIGGSSIDADAAHKHGQYGKHAGQTWTGVHNWTGATLSNLVLDGQAARTISSARNTTSNTAGNNLTIGAGGATSGATDKNGGSLLSFPGVPTNTGKASNEMWRYGRLATTGTTDNAAESVICCPSPIHLTNNVANSLFYINTIPVNTGGGLRIIYDVFCSDGTDRHVAGGHLDCVFSRGASGAARVAYLASTTLEDITKSPASTLTLTPSLLSTSPGANNLPVLQLTPASSLTPTTFWIRFSVIKNMAGYLDFF